MRANAGANVSNIHIWAYLGDSGGTTDRFCMQPNAEIIIKSIISRVKLHI